MRPGCEPGRDVWGGVMIEVDVKCWSWAPSGMQTSGSGGYVRVQDVERLLEEAHVRGREEGRLRVLSCECGGTTGCRGCDGGRGI